MHEKLKGSRLWYGPQFGAYQVQAANIKWMYEKGNYKLEKLYTVFLKTKKKNERRYNSTFTEKIEGTKSENTIWTIEEKWQRMKNVITEAAKDVLEPEGRRKEKKGYDDKWQQQKKRLEQE